MYFRIYIWLEASHTHPTMVQLRVFMLLVNVLSKSRHRFDLSKPFEELCRRVEGIVVESRHPYPKVVLYGIGRFRRAWFGRRSDSCKMLPRANMFWMNPDSEWRALAVHPRRANVSWNASGVFHCRAYRNGTLLFFCFFLRLKQTGTAVKKLRFVWSL